MRRVCFAISIGVLGIGLVGTLVFLVWFVRNFTKPGFIEPGYPGIRAFGHEWDRTMWWQPLLVTAIGGVAAALLGVSAPRRSEDTLADNGGAAGPAGERIGTDSAD